MFLCSVVSEYFIQVLNYITFAVCPDITGLIRERNKIFFPCWISLSCLQNKFQSLLMSPLELEIFMEFGAFPPTAFQAYKMLLIFQIRLFEL